MNLLHLGLLYMYHDYHVSHKMSFVEIIQHAVE
jgi:hypothetical protein